MVLHKQNDVVNRVVSNQNLNDWAFLRFTNGILNFYKIINTETKRVTTNYVCNKLTLYKIIGEKLRNTNLKH